MLGASVSQSLLNAGAVPFHLQSSQQALSADRRAAGRVDRQPVRLACRQLRSRPNASRLTISCLLASHCLPLRQLSLRGRGHHMQLWCLTAVLCEWPSPLIRSTGRLFCTFPRVQFSSSDNWRAAIVVLRVKVLDQAGWKLKDPWNDSSDSQILFFPPPSPWGVYSV